MLRVRSGAKGGAKPAAVPDEEQGDVENVDEENEGVASSSSSKPKLKVDAVRKPGAYYTISPRTPGMRQPTIIGKGYLKPRQPPIGAKQQKVDEPSPKLAWKKIVPLAKAKDDAKETAGVTSLGAESLGAKSLTPNAKPSLAKAPAGLLRPKIQPVFMQAKVADATKGNEIEDDAIAIDSINDTAAEDTAQMIAGDAIDDAQQLQAKSQIAIPKLLSKAKSVPPPGNFASSVHLDSYPVVDDSFRSLPLLSKASAPVPHHSLTTPPHALPIGQRVQRPADRKRLIAINEKLQSTLQRMASLLSDDGRKVLDGLPDADALGILLEAEAKADQWADLNTFIAVSIDMKKGAMKGPESVMANASAKSMSVVQSPTLPGNQDAWPKNNSAWSQADTWTDSWANEGSDAANAKSVLAATSANDVTNQKYWESIPWGVAGHTTSENTSWPSQATQEWNGSVGVAHASQWGTPPQPGEFNTIAGSQQLSQAQVAGIVTIDSAPQSTDTWDSWDEPSSGQQAMTGLVQNTVASGTAGQAWDTSTNINAVDQSWQSDSGASAWSGWGEQPQHNLQSGQSWQAAQVVLPPQVNTTGPPSVSAPQVVIPAPSAPRVVLPLNEQVQKEHEKPSDPRMRPKPHDPNRRNWPPMQTTAEKLLEEVVTFHVPIELELRLQALTKPLLAMPDLSEVRIERNVGVPHCSVLVRGARHALDSVQEKLHTLLTGRAIITAYTGMSETPTSDFPAVLVRGLQDILGHGAASVVLGMCGKVVKWHRLPPTDSGERSARCLFESPQDAWRACRLLHGRRVEERIVYASLEETAEPIVQAWRAKRAGQLRQDLGELDDHDVDSVLEKEADSLRPRLDAKLSTVLIGGRPAPAPTQSTPPPPPHTAQAMPPLLVAPTIGQGSSHASPTQNIEPEVGGDSLKKKRGLPKPLPSNQDSKQGRSSDKNSEKKEKDRAGKSRSRSPRHRASATLPPGQVSSKLPRLEEVAHKKRRGSSPRSKSVGGKSESAPPMITKNSEDDVIKAAADAAITAAADAAAEAIGWDPYML